MKAIVALILLLSACATAQVEMSPQYAVYDTSSVDSINNIIYTTISIQGVTNPYNCTYGCGPYGQTCTWNVCADAQHIPSITINGQTSTGPAYGPAQQMNYAVTTATQITNDMLTNGSQNFSVDSADLYCTGLGGYILQITLDDELAVTKDEWNRAITGPTVGCVQFSDGYISCPYPVSPRCEPSNSPPDANVGTVNSGYDPTYNILDWISVTPCYRDGYSGPWLCGPGVAIKVATNPVPPTPLFPCTHNP
jgi:hypothetical protein